MFISMFPVQSSVQFKVVQHCFFLFFKQWLKTFFFFLNLPLPSQFPITALREIKILQLLKHENVVNLIEICRTKGKMTRETGSVQIAHVATLQNAQPQLEKTDATWDLFSWSVLSYYQRRCLNKQAQVWRRFCKKKKFSFQTAVFILLLIAQSHLLKNSCCCWLF